MSDGSVRPAPGGEATTLPRALFSVTRGDPSAAELAALTVALLGRLEAGADTAVERVPRSGWADPTPLLRQPLTAGPDGWRRAMAPR